MQDSKKYFKENLKKNLNDFEKYISLKTVSTKTDSKLEIKKAQKFLIKRLKDAGFSKVMTLKCDGNDPVYAEYCPSKNNKTVLFYGHYDVQPAEMKDGWKSDPFKLQIEKNRLVARGVADNKIHNFSILLGCEFIIKVLRIKNINIKFLIEGEEEIGSKNLHDIVLKNKNLLASDVAVVVDSERDFDGPTIVKSLRGLVGFNCEVRLFKDDIHSGIFGGTVNNPIFIASKIIRSIKDDNGKILINGFYDNVKPIDALTKKMLKLENAKKEKEIKFLTNVVELFGEKSFNTLERAGLRPTFDVHGFHSGYDGEGIKTIIPSKANFSFSFRLVANQKADEIEKKVEKHLSQFDKRYFSFKKVGGNDPVSINDKNLFVKTAFSVLENVYQKKPRFVHEGGSIGSVLTFKKVLNVESVVTGFVLPDSKMHSVGENATIDNMNECFEFTLKYLLSLANE